MKIASTTLVGPGCEALFEEAVASVANAVDLVIVIPTSMEVDDRELRRCARRGGIRQESRFHLQRWGWCDDFAAARNESLRIAFRQGADWAVTLDTDERLLMSDPCALREALALADTGSVGMALFEDGSYQKERAFRLPASERWHGRTHEFYPFSDKRFALHDVRVRELPKSPEAMGQKLARDLPLLREMIADEPLSGRWHFYLGQTLGSMGLSTEAVESYCRCGERPGWIEERAFAFYRAAEIECTRFDFEAAIRLCTLGLGVHAGFCELSWLAGYCSYKLGRYEQAIYWAHIAISGGLWRGCGRAFTRDGFRHPPAQYEAPFDVLCHAWRQLGNELQAQRAAKQCRWARSHRLGEKSADDESSESASDAAAPEVAAPDAPAT